MHKKLEHDGKYYMVACRIWQRLWKLPMASYQPATKKCNLQRAWGLFFAMERYEKVAVIRDSHNESANYGKEVIDIPILTTALEKNVNKFSEILEDQ